MKQTAVEWLAENIDNLIPYVNDESAKKFNELVEQAKEIEKEQMIEMHDKGFDSVVQLNDDYAIGFADWIRVCKLKGRPYDFDNIKELLEIYKDEKDL